MELDHLAFTGDAEKDKILHAAIENLPENTIKDLSAYEPADVSLVKDVKKGDLVKIKIDPHRKRLDLDLSGPGFIDIKIGERIEFTYQNIRYSVDR